MKVQIESANAEKAVLRVDEAHYALINALRRSMMYHIPTLAIEDVEIIQNATMFDEALAHRLGLVPLAWDDTDAVPEEGVQLSLKKETPGTVYAKDIETPDGVRIVHPDIPLTIVGEKQSVEVEAYARFGYGYDHAKWQAAIVSYKNVPSVNVKTEDTQQLQKIVEHLPESLVYMDNGSVYLSEQANPAAYERIAQLSDGNIVVTEDPNAFMVTVESVSGLTPREIVLHGIASLENAIESFHQELRDNT